MLVSSSIEVSGVSSAHISNADIKHPMSMQAHAKVCDLHFHISAWPKSSDADDSITVSAFVNGNQYVIFSGLVKEAEEFFKRFTRN
jgi:hypothetical protein